MTDEEKRALGAYRDALGGRRTRRGLTGPLIGVGSILAVTGLVGVGAMFFTGGDRKSLANPTGHRDAFLCEKALRDRNEDEKDAVADGKLALVGPGGGPLFYFCSPSKTEIIKTRGGTVERQTLLANAIYALEADGSTLVRGLEAEGLRFGWDGKVCRVLRPHPSVGLRVDGVPVDPASC